jgi:hypothetical protein
MAATKYQIFFRYINPRTGIAITNDLSHDYVETVEIIHQKHKLYAGNATEQLEAEQERDDMLVNGNSPTLCDKYDMIFAFGGAKKYYHKSWINAETASALYQKEKGFYVEDIQAPDGQVRTESANSDVEADENSITFAVAEAGEKAGAEETEAIDNLEDLCATANESQGTSTAKQDITYSLVNSSSYPYVVKDYYIRIPMSPWIKGSCYGSLEAAIEKCKTLVSAIGIANVKLVKLVAIRQKIKIV